ncbi:hypothetical protein Ciccas_005338, partial [Cichlidogyrus casuarinus]
APENIFPVRLANLLTESQELRYREDMPSPMLSESEIFNPTPDCLFACAVIEPRFHEDFVVPLDANIYYPMSLHDQEDNQLPCDLSLFPESVANSMLHEDPESIFPFSVSSSC